MTTTGATVQIGVRSPDARVADAISWPGLWPLLLSPSLLITGALIGYPFSLDAPVAFERLSGLIAASFLATAAVVCVRRVDRPAPVLYGAAVAALLAGLWVISASGPDVFRGTVGRALQMVCGPIFGLATVTDPVEVTNTRFIVGYNGLVDLCAVAIFCCGAVIFENRERPRWPATLVSVMAIVVALVVLVGTGARGGFTGVAAGLGLIGLYIWPHRYAFVAVVAAPVALAGAAIGLLDKGVEFSSTAGRLNYWSDLVRLLAEYPLTGVGLGVDTAYRVALQYEVNPDPGRIFYAHNTFVQSYLETGPLGALGMLLIPLAALGVAALARRCGVRTGQRPMLLAGLGIVGSMTAHGLTDQVVTTNVGTAMLLVAFAASVAALSDRALSVVGRWSRRAAVSVMCGIALTAFIFLVTPRGRAQALLDLSGLKTNQALALAAQSPGRGAALGDAEATLALALTQAGDQPAVLRELARVRSARYDDAGALEALSRAAGTPNLDAFDTLQLAHLYRDLGFAERAYLLASQAYAAWGRSTEDTVMQTYAQSTLAVLDDFRARTLAEQAEAAMRARHFGEAVGLFDNALTFQPDSAYLQDRLGAAQRAVAKYGP